MPTMNNVPAIMMNVLQNAKTCPVCQRHYALVGVVFDEMPEQETVFVTMYPINMGGVTPDKCPECAGARQIAS